MKPGPRLFSDKLDRLAFSAYFLGAVVPLSALAVVVDRFALPTLAMRDAQLGLLGLVASISVLSLGSFLVLRGATRRSLARMDRDNHRLSSLLRVSSRLAHVQHGTEAADTTTRCALELTEASASYLLLCGDGGAPSLLGAAGDGAEKRFQTIGDALVRLAGLTLEGGSAVSRSAAHAKDFSAVAVPLPGERRAIGALVAIRAGGAPFASDEIDALSTLAALSAVALSSGDLRDAQRNFFSHVTEIIVHALDSHLDFHQGHSERVAQLANRLGRELGLDEETLHRLHFAALLHDIGMLRLDRRQQMNPKACDKHTLLGARMLAPIRLWKDVAPIVQQHHEWFDGSGYPEGTAGQAIPLEARIIALCDAWDSMTSQNSYREAMAPEEALAELGACAGTQFDPGLVRSFRALLERGGI